MRALQQKLSAFAMLDEALEVLSDLSEDAWYWLQRGRMCGMTVHDLGRITALPARQRWEAFRAEDFRIDLKGFKVLETLTEVEWAALVRAAEYPVSENIVGMLDTLNKGTRAVLRSIAVRLGDAAPVSALASVTSDEWKLLRKHWHASPVRLESRAPRVGEVSLGAAGRPVASVPSSGDRSNPAGQGARTLTERQQECPAGDLRKAA